MIKYPEVEIKFDAKIKLVLYLFGYEPTIVGYCKRKESNKVANSIELDDPIVMIDYDENENVVGFEIIGGCNLGDLK